MYDPLGILNDTDTKQMQQDPLGILPSKKKVGGTTSNNGGGVGTSVPQSQSEDPVKDIIDPVRQDYQNKSQNYLQLKGVNNGGDIQRMKQPFMAELPQAKAQANTPSELTQATQARNKSATTLQNVTNHVKQNYFKNGQEAKQLLTDAAANGKLNPNNETQQLAKEKSDELDILSNDVYGQDGTGSIASAALKERMRQDPNFAQKYMNLKKEGLDLPEAEEGSIIHDFMQKHDNDLQLLSSQNPEIKEDYDDISKNLINKYGDFGNSLIANKISQEREKRNYNSSVANFNTNTFHKNNEDVAKSVLNPDELQRWENNKDAIEKQIVRGGFFNRAVNTIGSDIQGTKEMVQRMTGTEPSKGESAYNDLQQEGGGVTSGEKGWKQAWGTLGDFTGHMIYMGLLNKGLGEAGIPENVASKASVPLTFGNDIMKEQEAIFPNDDTKAKVSGLLKMGLMTFMNPFHADKASKAIDDILSKATDDESIYSLRNKLVKAITTTTGETGKAAGQMLTYTGGSQIVDKALGLDNETYSKYHPEGEAYSSLKQGALAGAIPGVLGGISEISRSKPEQHETEKPTPNIGANTGEQPTEQNIAPQQSEGGSTQSVGASNGQPSSEITPAEQQNINKSTSNKFTELIPNEGREGGQKEQQVEPEFPKSMEISAGKSQPVRLTGTNIVEHAEDEYTSQHKENGTSNSPLTEVGKQQASNLGEMFGADPRINEIYTGDMERGKETASIAAQKANEMRGNNSVKVTVVPELTALDKGEWTGKPTGSFPLEEYAKNPNEVIKGTDKTFGGWMEQTEKGYKFSHDIDETKAVVTSSGVMNAFRALSATDGKWNEDSLNEFLRLEKEKHGQENPSQVEEGNQKEVPQKEEQPTDVSKMKIELPSKMDWVDAAHFGKMKDAVLGDRLKDQQKELRKKYSALKSLLDC